MSEQVALNFDEPDVRVLHVNLCSSCSRIFGKETVSTMKAVDAKKYEEDEPSLFFQSKDVARNTTYRSCTEDQRCGFC